MTKHHLTMARRVAHRASPGALAPLLLVGCLGRADLPNPPAPLLTVASGNTVVEVERATGALRVLEGTTPLAALTVCSCLPGTGLYWVPLITVT